MVADFFSALTNQVGATLNNALSYQYSKKLAKYEAELNYKYARKNAENSPSWQRQGLESAGYNPMLAIQNGIGSSNSSWSTADQFNMQQPTTNAIDLARLRNETNTAESQIELNNANSELANAQAVEQVIKNKYVDESIKTQLANTLASTKQMETLADFQKEQSKYVGYNAVTGRINANANDVSSQANMLNARINDYLAPQQMRNLREAGLLTEAQTKYYHVLARTKGPDVANQWLRTIGAIGITGGQLYMMKKLDIKNPIGF